MSVANPIEARQMVLVVARDDDYRLVVVAALRSRGYDVLDAAEQEEASALVGSRRPDAIVTDVQATGTFSPLPQHADAPVVIIASDPSEAALRGLRARATEVLVKPLSLEQLTDAVAVAMSTAKRSGKHRRVIAGAGDVVTRSSVMRQLLAEVERLRDSDCSVLILGETGTGKTMMARRIHTIGARARGPFVDLNCSGLTTELVESELFGHERGSFTGALATKQGLFDIADDGTLFLDEIGDIDMRVQPRILKVLEEKRFRRMGDVRERSVDVRLIAATHQDLLASVAERRFRADLYYRISTIRLVMPALRERREDIMAIVAQMLDRVGQSDVTLSRDAEQRLVEHMWPGNVRELKNVIESSMLLRRGAMLTADDLRFDTLSHRMLAVAPVSNGVSQRGPIHVASARYLGEDATDATRAEVERAHIRNALLAEKGRVEAAARRLGIPRSTLYWKLKRYGLKPNGEELPPLEVG